MRIGKRRAALGQRIDMRRLHHRMSAHVADPIILIVDRDHENVRFFLRGK